MTNKTIYYVYAYIRANESATGKLGEPYYIGKGCNNRAYIRHGRISVPKDISKIIFIETNLTEAAAFILEQSTIKHYGRVNNSTGVLHNLTDGGEGVSGLIMTEDARENMRRSKDIYRVIELRRFKETKCVLVSELQLYLDAGWTIGLSEEHREENKIDRYESLSEKLTGRSFYSRPDGTYYGRLYKDYPDIQKLGLITSPKTELQSVSAKTNLKSAVAFNTDTLFYNDGVKNKKFKTDPGTPWILGCIDWDRSAQSAGCSAKLKGSQTWNNGIAASRFRPGTQPEGWIRGMLPRNR